MEWLAEGSAQKIPEPLELDRLGALLQALGVPVLDPCSVLELERSLVKRGTNMLCGNWNL